MDLVDKFQPDKQIENYRFSLQACIGKGSSGTVYVGRHQSTQQIIAIKAIDMRSVKTDYAWRMLCSEIRIMKRLNHPHVVRMLDVFQTKNNTYIISEFCNQGDLRSFIRKKRAISPTIAITIISQILSGLAELSAQGIIHRDLKPANILIDNDTFKITDFGFAKKLDCLDDQLMDSLVGTPLYMAPQILNKQKYTSKCDVWSLGLILYELIYGRTPWPALNLVDLVQKITTTPLIFPDTPQIAQPLKQFLENCLAYSETDRYSISDMTNNQLFKPYIDSIASIAAATTTSTTAAAAATVATTNQQQQQQSTTNTEEILTPNRHHRSNTAPYAVNSASSTNTSHPRNRPEVITQQMVPTQGDSDTPSSTARSQTTQISSTPFIPQNQQTQQQPQILPLKPIQHRLQAFNESDSPNELLQQQQQMQQYYVPQGIANNSSLNYPKQTQSSSSSSSFRINPPTIDPITTPQKSKSQNNNYNEELFEDRQFSATPALSSAQRIYSADTSQKYSALQLLQLQHGKSTNSNSSFNTTTVNNNNNNNTNSSIINNSSNTPARVPVGFTPHVPTSPTYIQRKIRSDSKLPLRPLALEQIINQSDYKQPQQQQYPHHQHSYLYQQQEHQSEAVVTQFFDNQLIPTTAAAQQQYQFNPQTSQLPNLVQQPLSTTPKSPIHSNSGNLTPSNRHETANYPFALHLQQQRPPTPTGSSSIAAAIGTAQQNINPTPQDVSSPQLSSTADSTSAAVPNLISNIAATTLPRKQQPINYSPSRTNSSPLASASPLTQSPPLSPHQKRMRAGIASTEPQQQQLQFDSMNRNKPMGTNTPTTEFSTAIQQQIAFFQKEARQLIVNQQQQQQLQQQQQQQQPISDSRLQFLQQQQLPPPPNPRSRSIVPTTRNTMHSSFLSNTMSKYINAPAYNATGSQSPIKSPHLYQQQQQLSFSREQPIQPSSPQRVRASSASRLPSQSHSFISRNNQSIINNISSISTSSNTGTTPSPTMASTKTTPVSTTTGTTPTNMIVKQQQQQQPIQQQLEQISSSGNCGPLMESMLGLCESLSTLRNIVEQSMPRLLSLDNDNFLYEKLVFLLHRHSVSIASTLKSAICDDPSVVATHNNSTVSSVNTSLRAECSVDSSTLNETQKAIASRYSGTLEAARSHWSSIKSSPRFLEEAKKDYYFSKIFNASTAYPIGTSSSTCEDNTNFYFYLYQLLKSLIKKVFSKLESTQPTPMECIESTEMQIVLGCLSRLVDYHQLLKLLISLKEDFPAIFKALRGREQTKEQRGQPLTQAFYATLKQKMYIYDLIAH